MLADFLQKLEAMTIDAKRPLPLTVEGERGVSRYVIDGEVKEYKHSPPVLSPEVDTVTSLVGFLSHCETGSCEVYVDDGRAVAILDRESRQDRVSLRLQPTAVSSSVASLTAGRRGSAKETVDFLRKSLDLGWHHEIVVAAGRIDFSTEDKAGAGITRGDESISRSVKNKVAQIDSIPEFFQVEFQAFTGIDVISTSVRINLDVDLTNRAIELWVHKDSLQEAALASLRSLQAFLINELGDIPVYAGSP